MALSWFHIFASIGFSFVICPAIIFSIHLGRIKKRKVIAAS